MEFLKDRIRELCNKEGITFARLEKNLGFSNAYIAQMNPETVPHSRIQKIADYFGVTVEYLTTGETNDGYYLNQETAKAAQEMFENEDLRVLFDAARDASPEDLRVVYEMLLALKRKEQNNTDDPA